MLFQREISWSNYSSSSRGGRDRRGEGDQQGEKGRVQWEEKKSRRELMDRSGHYEVDRGLYQESGRMEAAGRRAGKPERTRRNEEYMMDGERRMTHEDEGLRMMNEGTRRLDEGGMKRMNEGEYSNERLEKRCLAMFCTFFLFLFLLFFVKFSGRM